MTPPAPDLSDPALAGVSMAVLPEEVGYFAFGSNLFLERLTAYLTSASDSRPPRAAFPMQVPHRMFFASVRTTLWGSTCGAAVLEMQPSAEEALGRVYIITRQQFIELAARENLATGAPCPTYTASDCLHVGALERFSAQLLREEAFYVPFKVKQVGALEVWSLTAHYSTKPYPVAPPSIEYLRVIAAGLKQTYPSLSDTELAQYLALRQGVMGRYSMADMAQVMDEVGRGGGLAVQIALGTQYPPRPPRERLQQHQLVTPRWLGWRNRPAEGVRSDIHRQKVVARTCEGSQAAQEENGMLKIWNPRSSRHLSADASSHSMVGTSSLSFFRTSQRKELRDSMNRRDLQRQGARLAIAGACLFVVITLFLVVFIWLPGLLVPTQLSLEDKDRVAGQNSVRVAGVAGLVAIGGAATAYFGARTYGLNRQGQFTDRYAKAVEQLGQDNAAVQLGGIYALERIAQDSLRDRGAVIEVLSAFVREHCVPAEQPDSRARITNGAEEPAAFRRLPTTVLAAFAVLARRPQDDKSYPVPDFRNARLDRADLSAARLWGADLTGAVLTGANLRAANLNQTNLGAADLRWAYIGGAQLRAARCAGALLAGADLTDADLTGADLTEADLTDADLARAIVKHVRGLTRQQIGTADAYALSDTAQAGTSTRSKSG